MAEVGFHRFASCLGSDRCAVASCRPAPALGTSSELALTPGMGSCSQLLALAALAYGRDPQHHCAESARHLAPCHEPSLGITQGLVQATERSDKLLGRSN